MFYNNSPTAVQQSYLVMYLMCPHHVGEASKTTLHKAKLDGMIHEETHLCNSRSCQNTFENIQT